MNLKQHLLAALREEFDQWEELLARLDPAQLQRPLEPSPWTVKDVLAHLHAWQLRSIARCEAAAQGREPHYPAWPEDFDPEALEITDQLNAWLYETYRDQPWSQVYQAWRADFERLIELGQAISERDLLDAERYPWLEGWPLALVLVGTYDHHQEHLEKLQAWLQTHGAAAAGASGSGG